MMPLNAVIFGSILFLYVEAALSGVISAAENPNHNMLPITCQYYAEKRELDCNRAPFDLTSVLQLRKSSNFQSPQHLDIRNQPNLTELIKTDFARGWTALETIVVANTGLSTIEPETFGSRSLEQLKSVAFESNPQLTKVPWQIFPKQRSSRHSHRIKTLHLKRQPIRCGDCSNRWLLQKQRTSLKEEEIVRIPGSAKKGTTVVRSSVWNRAGLPVNVETSCATNRSSLMDDCSDFLPRLTMKFFKVLESSEAAAGRNDSTGNEIKHEMVQGEFHEGDNVLIECTADFPAKQSFFGMSLQLRFGQSLTYDGALLDETDLSSGRSNIQIHSKPNHITAQIATVSATKHNLWVMCALASDSFTAQPANVLRPLVVHGPPRISFMMAPIHDNAQTFQVSYGIKGFPIGRHTWTHVNQLNGQVRKVVTETGRIEPMYTDDRDFALGANRHYAIGEEIRLFQFKHFGFLRGKYTLRIWNPYGNDSRSFRTEDQPQPYASRTSVNKESGGPLLYRRQKAQTAAVSNNSQQQRYGNLNLPTDKKRPSAAGYNSRLWWILLLMILSMILMGTGIAALLFVFDRRRRLDGKKENGGKMKNGSKKTDKTAASPFRCLNNESIPLRHVSDNLNYNPVINFPSEVPILNIDDLKILSELGEGAFGKVFLVETAAAVIADREPLTLSCDKRALSRELSRSTSSSVYSGGRYAAKCVKLGGPEGAGCLAKEASHLAKLNHDNIVRFHGVCIPKTTNSSIYLLFEYMELGDLRSYLHERGPHAHLLMDTSATSSNFHSEYNSGAGGDDNVSTTFSTGTSSISHNGVNNEVVKPFLTPSITVNTLLTVVSDSPSSQTTVLHHHNNQPSHLSSSLKQQRGCVGLMEQLDMCLDIARGLSFLQRNHFIHRDLAARNCLVSYGPVVKISDFGMSRDIYCEDYYRIEGHRLLPVRWMAPEAFLYGKFNPSTDIWSFGVVMWEIFTIGKQPWYGYANHEVIQRVKEGEILEPPKEAHKLIQDLMISTWNYEESTRPSADKIMETLSEIKAVCAEDMYLKLGPGEKTE